MRKCSLWALPYHIQFYPKMPFFLVFCHSQDGNWQWMPESHICVKYVQTKYNLADAKANCEKMKSFLFEPKENKTNTEVWKYNFGYWIGITDQNHENNFRYLKNNRKIIWNNWADDQPNNLEFKEHCVVVGKVTGKWYDVPCDSEYNSICELPLK